MQIINTFDHVPNCFTNGVFDMVAWRKYTKLFSVELGEKCEIGASKYNFNEEVLPILNNILNEQDKLNTLCKSFITITQNLKNNINLLFQEEIQLDIILYLGLCNGAGSATTLDNRNAILLGIEKIIELDWQSESNMQALINHEVGHIWHKTYGQMYSPTLTLGDASLQQLHQEGVAMRCEQILCGNDCLYHQDKNGWLKWCASNIMDIKQEFLERINNNISTQDFFGDWVNYKGYSDVGYYLGCEFVKHLETKYTLVEIANLNSYELSNNFKQFLL